MIAFADHNQPHLSGPAGTLPLRPDDEIALKFAMLYEGQCEGLGATKAAAKYGYGKARYFQLLHLLQHQGALALQSKPTGPKANYRRTDAVVRQVIRYRFLDAEASAEVIAQKLAQTHHRLSIRTVRRVIADYGLQKRTLRFQSQGPAPDHPHAAHGQAPTPRTRRSPKRRAPRAPVAGPRRP